MPADGVDPAGQDASLYPLGDVLARARFWEQWPQVLSAERQRQLLHRLLDGLAGKLTS